MATATVNSLNSLLRGELSAVETYEQALAKLDDTKASNELRRIHDEHSEAVSTLRQHVHQHGGQPPQSSGAWGAFAKAVEGTAKLLGSSAALKALKEGEEHGIKQYETVLQTAEVPADCKAVISSMLLPRTRQHVPVLDRLMAGLVERITPQEARRHLDSDPSALLVCAYDSDEKFEETRLEGAIPLSDFKARAGALPKDREVIFYCG